MFVLINIIRTLTTNAQSAATGYRPAEDPSVGQIQREAADLRTFDADSALLFK